MIPTCHKEFFSESATVKGSDFLLQDYDEYPENKEMERVL